MTYSRNHRIELPSALKVHTFHNLFAKTDFFPEPSPTKFTLAFHPKYSQFEPFALAMLAAWAQYWIDRNVEIECENLSAKGVAYAQSLGLFRFLPAAPSKAVQEHEASGRFLQIQRIQQQSDLSRVIGELGSLVRNSALIEVVQYVMAEMARNVLEHAQSDAFICVQHYRAANRVSIGVADTGQGLYSSLERNYRFRTDKDSLVGALRPGVSGTISTPYGSSDNAGLGLFYARGLAKLSRQYFMIVSGASGYRLSKKQDTLIPNRDAQKDTHYIYDNLQLWKGTILAIDIKSTNATKASMMQEIGANAIPDDGLSGISSKIRFT